MRSMTGYGRGESRQQGYKITTELSSVNRKQSEITVYLPRELEPLEARVRNDINKHFSRGRLTVRITRQAGGESGPPIQINVKLAKAYVFELRKLAAELNLQDTITLDGLVRAPGVFRTDEDLGDAESFWPGVQASLQDALVSLVKMRDREGAHLAKDLLKRAAIMKKSVARIQKRAPEMVKRYQQQLRERIRAAGLEIPGLEDERLLKEVIYFADRSDITEELTRLQSHFMQVQDCAKTNEPIGRTLDFLAQEMNREINTIGSKAADALVAQEVVNLKAELEKFREQVQNVE